MGLKIIHDEADRRRGQRRQRSTDVNADRRDSDRRTGDRRGPDREPLPTCEIDVPAEVEAKGPEETAAWVQAARAQWRHERLQARDKEE